MRVGSVDGAEARRRGEGGEKRDGGQKYCHARLGRGRDLPDGPAMAVIASFDDEVQWREIVRACGGYDYLRAISKRAGNLRIDGFTRYQKGNRE